MGTRLRIVVHPADGAEAGPRIEETVAAAVAEVFDLVERLESSWSDWRDASELRALDRAAGGPAQPISRELLLALSAARDWAERTDGAFDPTIGPVTALWREARAKGELPDPAALARAAALVDWRKLEILAPTQGRSGTPDLAVDSRPSAGASARLTDAGMRLDLGGIGKGLAVDLVLDALRERGLSRALVDFGSAVGAGAPPPGATAWSVALPGLGGVPLVEGAVAISGDAEQFVDQDGVRHSHVTDPRTGAAMTSRSTVTVFAPSAADADALSTALTVLGPPGLALAEGPAERDPARGLRPRELRLEAQIAFEEEERGGRPPAVGERRRGPDGARRVVATPGFEARRRGARDGAATAGLPALRRREAGPTRTALDVATFTMQAPGLPELSVVGVAHVGEPSMYRRIDALLGAHDVVLYESVMPAGSRPPGGDDLRSRRASTRASMSLLADLLERVDRDHEESPRRGAEAGRLLRDPRRATDRAEGPETIAAATGQEAGEMPAPPRDLAALAEAVGPLDSRLPAIVRALAQDAWGHPITVVWLDDDGADAGARRFELRSLGADGLPGGEGEAADLVVVPRAGVRAPARGAASDEDEGLQAQLAAALGLADQIRSIDYDRPGWHVADMTMDEFNAALARHGVEQFTLVETLAGNSLPAAVAKLMLRLVRFADGLLGGGIREAIKAIMVEILADPAAILASGAVEAGAVAVLIDERNQVAVDALAQLTQDLDRSAPDAGALRVAIFYGAAHLPDLVERLETQLGYRAVAVEWITAIEADLARAGMTPRQLAQLRRQIRAQLNAPSARERSNREERREAAPMD